MLIGEAVLLDRGDVEGEFSFFLFFFFLLTENLAPF